MQNLIIKIPNKFSFTDHGIFTFSKVLNLFDWTLKDLAITIDFSRCFRANYQALSLLTLYIWHLRTNGCYINFKYSYNREGASQMWQFMGAKGWHHVLTADSKNFNGNKHKPLIALRNPKDFTLALSKTESYTKNFNVEFEKTLRYVISEILYNTLEHGKNFIQRNGSNVRIPSIIQFTWYKNKKQLQFIVADTGVGIKSHMEQNYPAYESDEDAILDSLNYQVSGTFGKNDPYKSKDNAGVGLYISSNIVQKLNADMHIVSRKGLVHVSPTDKTQTPISANWPGTLVLVSLHLGKNVDINLHNLMSEIRSSAASELSEAAKNEESSIYHVNMLNFFGSYAENKQEAISYRDTYILPEIKQDKVIQLNFQGISSAPHSFLSALLATPIQLMGINSYKKIKVVNVEPEIRETIDCILDDNTSTTQ
jgi:hypothetical protein